MYKCGILKDSSVNPVGTNRIILQCQVC